MGECCMHLLDVDSQRLVILLGVCIPEIKKFNVNFLTTLT